MNDVLSRLRENVSRSVTLELTDGTVLDARLMQVGGDGPDHAANPRIYFEVEGVRHAAGDADFEETCYYWLPTQYVRSVTTAGS